MDAVIVKVGGSLAMQPSKLRALCKKLTVLSRIHRLIVLPGGGEFADAVRNMDTRFNLSAKTAHCMAILGMDQYGLALADLIGNSLIVTRFQDLALALDSGKVPIFLPSEILLHEEEVENSWDVTSDSIAVFLAAKLHLKRVILVTDVDGIFTSDPKKTREPTLLSEMSVAELSKERKRTSVDTYLPKLLKKSAIECFVINGLYPERVEAVLQGKTAICTLIANRSRIK